MNKWKKWMTIGMTLTVGAAVITGCGGNEKADSTKDQSAVIESSVSEPETKETEAVKEAKETTATVNESESKDADQSVFREMAEYGYTYASGAGGWSTELTVHEDGSFEGGYSDADRGDTGTNYPNGTIYTSNFSGKFSTLEKVNEYTYKTSIQTLHYSDPVGKETIEDGVKYICTTANGLNEAGDIYIYAKGAPVSQLPEGYMTWASSWLEDKNGSLPWYGIYNETDDAGFCGWSMDEAEEPSNWESTDEIQTELDEVEERAQKIQDKLNGANLTQGDMNQLSAQLYSLWDDELNAIWKRLKDTMDADSMKQITMEERAWIKERDEKIREAGSAWEGGSGQPLAENQEGADLTRARVYELAEYLKN